MAQCFIGRDQQTEPQRQRQDLLREFEMNLIYPVLETDVVVETGERCSPDCPNCGGEDERVIVVEYVRETQHN
jgi:hypothetical protein